MTDYNVRVVQTNAKIVESVINDENVDIPLPAFLTNAVLNFSFELDNEPIIDDVEGTAIITGRYKNGRIQSIATIDLSTVNSYKLIGKYTLINIALSDLVTADKVIISVDQNLNIV